MLNQNEALRMMPTQSPEPDKKVSRVKTLNQAIRAVDGLLDREIRTAARKGRGWIEVVISDHHIEGPTEIIGFSAPNNRDVLTEIRNVITSTVTASGFSATDLEGLGTVRIQIRWAWC